MCAEDQAQRLLESQADLLGEQVLAGGGDPSLAACAAQLPELVGYTFLGNELSSRILYVEPDGRLGVTAGEFGPVQFDSALFDPRELLPPATCDRAKRRLYGGYLPAIDYSFFDSAQSLAWQEIAFVRPTRPDLLVFLRIVRAGGREAVLRLQIGERGKIPVSSERFEDYLRELGAHWTRALGSALRLEGPEAAVSNACLASLVRAFITHDGPRARYGVGLYREPRHDAFPPATLSTVNACVEWNLLARARAHLDDYLDRLVRPDGTFDYYAPAVSEYGQMLDAIARYARRSRDHAWLRERVPVVERIAGHLLALRRAAQEKWPRDDPRHGLLFGPAEADTAAEPDYYYSGSGWAWRGWLETARAYAALGDDTLSRRAAELTAECHALHADLEASLRACVVPITAPPFVPPVAGRGGFFHSMTADRFASYTNYRYWPEMLSAGFLRPEWHDALIAYRAAHGGELLGTTRFLDRLDDWPYAGYAYGLLLRDRVRHFLLGYYGDLAVHRTPGTYTAYEQVAIRGAPTRRPAADYCVPAQLVTPLMTRWMLAFEEPDADLLWLGRALPRAWLAAGQRISVERATTRWGLAGFELEAKSGGLVAARVHLPDQGRPAELRLRLRRPGAPPLQSVTVNGRPHADFDPQGEFIRIRRPEGRTLEITAQ
ncbi:MAG TPA: hypothetical protein PLE19_08415 [Planctomycetota bacterium]|nr:hypothetical protein [Planctomycetota bacterium]HRR82057.1 hypothetical protein [Planctomycetota bacterium]HRT94520.1 hypothetical protein [Planctomycetota bacterium]